MPPASDRHERRTEIEAAAFALLKELGYKKTSMLLIAKRAQASNQTLYAWYRNKQELFRGIIASFGGAVREQLQASLQAEQEPQQALRALGPTLLRFTTDEYAIIMNRAAVIDAAETGVLPQAIDEVARDVLYPLICALMQRLVHQRVFVSDMAPEVMAQTYIDLLLGELQFRQALGNVPPLSEPEMIERSERAFRLTCRLFQRPEAP